AISFSEEKMPWKNTGVGGRIGMARIQGQQLVQPGGARAPMSENEHGVQGNVRFPDATTPEALLENTEEGIVHRVQANERRPGEVARRHGIAVMMQQPQPPEDIPTHPDFGNPLAMLYSLTVGHK